jgi:hypothetical protein
MRSSRTPDRETPGPLILSFALLSLLSLTACVTNKSSDPRLSSVMHKCFQTTDDAVVYETPFCPPQPGLSNSSTCVTVKYLGSFYPRLTLREFKSTSARVDEQVMHELRRPSENYQGGIFAPSSDKVRVFGALIWPTSFTIVSMRRYADYENDAFWIVTAQIRDGEFAGRAITLPWNSIMRQFPGRDGWITDHAQQNPIRDSPYPPQIDSKKMVPCEPRQ